MTDAEYNLLGRTIAHEWWDSPRIGAPAMVAWSLTWLALCFLAVDA